jgi:hypothetical protein
MTTYANGKWPSDVILGGTTLKAAALVATDTASTAVYLGKGKFRVVTTWTACEIDNNDELYHVTLEANTRAVTGTWYEIACLAVLGDSVATGRGTDEASTGSKQIIVDNPYDYQVRVNTLVNGTVSTGCNFSVIAYPLGSKD